MLLDAATKQSSYPTIISSYIVLVITFIDQYHLFFPRDNLANICTHIQHTQNLTIISIRVAAKEALDASITEYTKAKQTLANALESDPINTRTLKSKMTALSNALRGQGGVEGQNLDFLCFNICCSPSYEDSKMGSHTFQFCPVVILWQLARGHYARFFAKYNGNQGENIHF